MIRGKKGMLAIRIKGFGFSPFEILPLLSILLLYVIFCFGAIPGLDFDNVRWFVFQVVGVFLFGYSVLLGDAKSKERKFLIRNMFVLLGYLGIVAVMDYTSGYTLNELSKWVALIGVVMGCMQLGSDGKRMGGEGLVAVALIQVVQFVGGGVSFAEAYAGTNENGLAQYGFGGFRHKIRFASVLMMGLIPVLWKLRKA